MLIKMNVGLWVNGKAGNIGPRTVVSDVMRVFDLSTIKAAQRYAKSGEPTMVLEFETDGAIAHNINHLCNLLGQDCIALTVDGTGALIGPNTTPYGGKFNPDYFIED